MKLRYSIAASLMAIGAATAIATTAQAQQITTGIQGQVSDDNGAAIGGATVVVTDTRTGAARTITTGADGRFAATGLVTGGPYRISVAADAYEGQTIEDVYTSLQGNTALAFSLAAGGGEIVVTGTRVKVTQLAVGPGVSFNADVLQSAPTFNRDLRDIIRLDPRVSLDRDDGGSGQDRISCLGGNDRGNAFTVDGISQGDIYGLNDTGFSSRSSTPIPYDAIRETQVQFAPFDVDYGQFTGCAINAVTKSGTNDYHFGGFFEYSDNGMRGDNVKGIAVAPIEADKRWGVYLGGPVIKDRLFLFGAFERQRAGQPQDEGPNGADYPTEMPGVSKAQFDEIRGEINRIYGIDTGDLVYSRPYKNDRYFVRADWQINDDHRLEGTFQRLEETTLRGDDLATTGTFANTAVGRNTFLLSGTTSNYYSGRLYSQWSDRFSTELRFSRSEVRDIQDPFGGGEAQSANPIPRIIVGVDNGDDVAAGVVSAGPGFSRTANDLRTNVNQYRAVGRIDAGAHQIKFGAELSQASLFNLFVQNATGTLVFRNIDDLRAGLLSPGSNTTTSAANVVGGTAIGAYGNFSPSGDINDLAARFKRSIYSVFVQDEWEINSQLKAVGGVRVEWYDGGHPEANPNFMARYGFANTASFSNLPPIVMPRLALTYDADDFAIFGRPQFRAGVGIFSGGDPVVWFGNAFQNNGYQGEGRSTDAPCSGQLDVVNAAGQFTGLPECVVTAGTANASRGLGDTQSIDPDIKMPTVLRANAGFTSELNFAPSGFFSGWNLTVDYIYSRYRNPFNIIDLSQTPDIRKGLDGYMIDGRPIYAAIDPTVAGCNAQLTGVSPVPVWQNITDACFATSRDDELMLTNARGYSSQVASVLLSRNFAGGLFTSGGAVDFSVGYAFTDSNDRRSMYNSTAGSNFDNTAAFDRQLLPASRSFYSSKHNITAQLFFTENFFSDLKTKLGLTFVGRSGRPYSLTFSDGGVFADSSSGNDNALIYLPTGIDDPNISADSDMDVVAGLVGFANGLGCARKYIGRTVPRNSCSNDWYFDVDLSFSQEIPGPGRLLGKNDKLKLYATVDNFLNLLDNGWNVQRRRNYLGFQDLAKVSVGTDGRYVFVPSSANNPGYTNYDADNQINFSSSLWRIKIGVSYEF